MDIITYDPAEDTIPLGKIESTSDPYKTYNKINWGQLAMDLLEENRKTIEEIKKKKKFPLLQEHHIKEDFYIVKLNTSNKDKLYLVKAINSKEAIDKVWEQCVPINNDDLEYCEYELYARRVDDYFKETTESVICL